MIVSWSATYLKDGYEITITLTSDDLAEVMAEGKALLREMQKSGIQPVRTRPIPPRPHRTVRG